MEIEKHKMKFGDTTAPDVMLAVIKEVHPLPGADRLEITHAGNWPVVVGKGQFKPGSLALYIQPDAVIPEAPWTEAFYKFTSKGRVKSANIRGVRSNGILLPLWKLLADAKVYQAKRIEGAMTGEQWERLYNYQNTYASAIMQTLSLADADSVDWYSMLSKGADKTPTALTPDLCAYAIISSWLRHMFGGIASAIAQDRPDLTKGLSFRGATSECLDPRFGSEDEVVYKTSPFAMNTSLEALGYLAGVADTAGNVEGWYDPVVHARYYINKFFQASLGITHYEAPTNYHPDNKDVTGRLPDNMRKTDQENWESIPEAFLPLGETCLVTRKMDGCSATYIARPDGTFEVYGRKQRFSLEAVNHYTLAAEPFKDKLIEWAKTNDRTIAIRGEIVGSSIQKFKTNKDAVGEPTFHMFSVEFPEELERGEDWCRGWYGTPNHFLKINEELGIKTVPILGEVTLTKDMLVAYQNAPLTDGEGVVINHGRGSFKAKSQEYYASI